jgi:di/tricarboxylate transporter
MVTSSGIYVILAVQRKGIDVDFEPTILAPGDTLLLQGTWDSLDRGVGTEGDVLIVDTPTTIRRQALPLGPRSTSAIVILVVMVFLLATGLVIPAVAALLAAGAMVLTNVVSLQDAYRSISWTTVVLVAAMIPVSQAVEDSGAADQIANLIIDIVGGYSPYIVLLALFLLTALFGQLISNMATALIVIPIGVTAAADLGLSARPVLMCITVAAAGAFLTPVATPANLMVMSAAGYQFRDYWKLGLPLLIIFMAAAVFLVPVFWGF